MRSIIRWCIRIVLAAAAEICLSRALGYSNVLTPAHESPGPAFLTDGGVFLPAWASAWGLCGVLLIMESLRCRPLVGLPLMGGLSIVWSGSYLWVWARSGFESPDVLTGCLYAGVGTMTLTVGVLCARVIQYFQDHPGLTGMVGVVAVEED